MPQGHSPRSTGQPSWSGQAGPSASSGPTGAPVTLGLAFQMKELTLIPSFTYGHHHGADEFAEATRILDAVPDLD